MNETSLLVKFLSLSVDRSIKIWSIDDVGSLFRFLFVWALILSELQAAPAIFPLKEVKPGLKGKCWTVFSGTKIQAFDFEVMGIAKDFAGPRRDIIWCKMTSDPTGQMVVAAGMSGSPCFISDRNMGALAYGWEFNKDPIFGVQPIESMLELLDFKGNEPQKTRTAHAANTWSSPTPFASSSASTFLKSLFGFRSPISLLSSKSVAQMVPLPLEVSGLHPLIADRVSQGLNEAGFLPVMTTGGGLSTIAEAAEILPGSALTGVIATGDLNIAATGTLTWKDGNQILAFGHPFLGAGAVQIPMGKAEIIGVVSSYMRSMKMSNKGNIIGTLTQDRLSAVCGTLGLMPKMVPMQVRIRNQGSSRSYNLSFCDNKFFTPVVYQMALLQFLANVMERSDETSLKIVSDIQLDGMPPLHYEDAFAGEQFSWVFEAVNSTAAQLMSLYSSEFEIPAIRKISIDVEITPKVERAVLQEVMAEPLQAHPGDTLRLRAGFQPWHGKRIYRDYEIQLPEELKSGEVEVILADAQRAHQLLGVSNNSFDGNRSSTGSEPRNMEQTICMLNQRYRNDHLYLLLQKKSEGLYVQNQRLPSLPPSVRKLLLDDQSADHPATLSDTILFQKPIHFESVVQGSRSVKIKIK